jgi:predicted metal-dependent phosphoesterase TrpH
MALRADFHTHSVASPDGGLSDAHYERMLASGRLNFVAVTDHNTIDKALELHAIHGDKINVGEEITTTEGEIIGLFLSKAVPAGLTATETVEQIKSQGGVVYVPHPFETVRSGVSVEVLDRIAGQIDIVEVRNGRAVFQDKSKQAKAWAAKHQVAGAASSDAHGKAGWGRTYTLINDIPTAQNLVTLVKASEHQHSRPAFRGILYPKLNRIKKWRHHA